MNLSNPKYSNWSLVPGLVAFVLLGGALPWAACSASSPQVKVENPSELCATAVALSSGVKAQAAKLGVEPLELARRTCDAAILTAQVAEANLVNSSGIAGGTSSGLSPSMALAGTAGSGK